MIPNVAKHIGSDQAKSNKPWTSRLQILEFARRGHPHLEQEQAKHALEQSDKEVVVVAGDLLSLQAADRAR